MSERAHAKQVDELVKPNLVEDHFPLVKELKIKSPASLNPYKGLRPFKREDARLFFGRNQEVYQLCHQILLEEHPQLLLLDGYSGTGKSSLLQAGIIPRVQAKGWSVEYGRREEDELKGLPGVLLSLLERIKGNNHPTLIIIDQVEEAVTNPIKDEKNELALFFDLLERTLLNTTYKFVLGFRSEYTSRLKHYLGDLEHTQTTLQLLTFEGAVEAIRGVYDNTTLRNRYKINFSDPRLPEKIASHLFGQGDNYHLAPLLQVNMEILYESAKGNRKDGKALITPHLFENNLMPSYSTLLDHFLDQMEYGNTSAEQRQILEILDFYVEDKPASALRQDSTFDEHFQHYDRARTILHNLKDLYLLTSLEKGTRLTHDVLAPLVRQRFLDVSGAEDVKLRSTSQKLYLKEVRDQILHLQYEPAAQNLLEIVTELNYRIEDIVPELMGVSFVFNETKQVEKALSLLQPISRLEAYPWLRKELEGQVNEEKISRLLERVKPREYDKIYFRYYPKMIDIKGGNFLRENQEVSLSTFKMAQYQTTFWQYGIYALINKIDLKDLEPSWGIDGNNPVVNVKWYDAIVFANWLSKKHGLTPVYEVLDDQKDPNNLNDRDEIKWLVKVNWEANGYRLPTEAEWEYAARGGSLEVNRNYKYAGSNNIDEVAWYDKNAKRTMPVGQKKANGLNLFDMSGNVWEWCWDWRGDYSASRQNDPKGPEKGKYRVLRGGSWYGDDYDCEVSSRFSYNSPYDRGDDIGFRLSQGFTP